MANADPLKALLTTWRERARLDARYGVNQAVTSDREYYGTVNAALATISCADELETALLALGERQETAEPPLTEIGPEFHKHIVAVMDRMVALMMTYITNAVEPTRTDDPNNIAAAIKATDDCMTRIESALTSAHLQDDEWCGACDFSHDPNLGCVEAAEICSRTPTDAPESTGKRLLLNAYGRTCYESGKLAAHREGPATADQQVAQAAQQLLSRALPELWGDHVRGGQIEVVLEESDIYDLQAALSAHRERRHTAAETVVSESAGPALASPRASTPAESEKP